MSAMLVAAAFISGLIIGSFLNVCIFRVPRGESTVRPASRCPHCKSPIPAWRNIPVLSYLLQAGKCAECGRPIGWFYPVVELMTGAAFAGAYIYYGPTPAFVYNAVLFSLLIALVFIDLFDRILPDAMTLGGMAFGFVFSPFQVPGFFTLELTAAGWMNVYFNSLIGIATGGGFLWLVAFLYLKVRKIEGMGFGDVKLMGMIGAFMGWKFALLTIFFGSLVGAVLGSAYIYTLGKGKAYELPFGTFLGLGAIAVNLWGVQLMGWYLSQILP
jgi:leader peptidase (prepilin peptidase) / N-methyltransferase